MSEKVIVCSRLPFALVLEHPKKNGVKAELKGLNSARIKGASFVQTDVDADLWGAWKSANKGYPPMLNGAIYEAKTDDEAEGKAEDLKEVKTGLEPMPQEAAGVKPAEKD